MCLNRRGTERGNIESGMKHKSILVDAAFYTFAGYLVQPVTIVASIWTKAIIGPYLVGVFATLALVPAYSGFVNLGTLGAAERDLPFFKGANELDRFRRMRDTAFSLAIVAAAVCGIIILCGAFFLRPTVDGPMFMGLLVYGAMAAVQQLAFYHITMLRTRQEFVFLSKMQVLNVVITSWGGVLGAAVFGFPGLLAAGILAAVIQLTLFVRHDAEPATLRVDWVEVRHMVGVGVPLLIFGLVMTAMRTVDNILVLRLLGTEPLGMYSIALMANVALFGLTNSLSTVLYPRMQTAYGQNQTLDTLSRFVVRPTLVMGALLPLLTAVIFFGVPFAVDVFLPKFRPGLPAFRIVTVATYFFAMFQMASGSLLALNKQLRLTVLLAGGLAIAGGFSWWLSGRGWGIEGIAAATGLGYVWCFVAVNAYALRQWTNWWKVASFLWTATQPFLFGLLLLVLIEQGLHVPTATPMSAALLAVAKCVAFGVGYVPFLMFSESRTGVWRDIGAPFVGALRRRFV